MPLSSNTSFILFLVFSIVLFLYHQSACEGIKYYAIIKRKGEEKFPSWFNLKPYIKQSMASHNFLV